MKTSLKNFWMRGKSCSQFCAKPKRRENAPMLARLSPTSSLLMDKFIYQTVYLFGLEDVRLISVALHKLSAYPYKIFAQVNSIRNNNYIPSTNSAKFKIVPLNVRGLRSPSKKESSFYMVEKPKCGYRFSTRDI